MATSLTESKIFHWFEKNCCKNIALLLRNIMKSFSCLCCKHYQPVSFVHSARRSCFGLLSSLNPSDDFSIFQQDATHMFEGYTYCKCTGWRAAASAYRTRNFETHPSDA